MHSSDLWIRWISFTVHASLLPVRLKNYRGDDTNHGSQRGSRHAGRGSAISILFIRFRKRFSSGWSVADRKQSAAARWKKRERGHTVRACFPCSRRTPIVGAEKRRGCLRYYVPDIVTSHEESVVGKQRREESLSATCCSPVGLSSVATFRDVCYFCNATLSECNEHPFTSKHFVYFTHRSGSLVWNETRLNYLLNCSLVEKHVSRGTSFGSWIHRSIICWYFKVIYNLSKITCCVSYSKW